MSCSQIIPTQSQSVFYDLWQFDRRPIAVSVDSRLSFANDRDHKHGLADVRQPFTGRRALAP